VSQGDGAKERRGRAYDLFRSERHPLDAAFKPRSVAAIGASEHRGSVGSTVLENLLIHSFQGKVYPVNPNHSKVLGVQAYRLIAEAPRDVDLAVIVTLAPTVPGVMGECVDAGGGAAVVISVLFRSSAKWLHS
jgi:acetyltransferase